MSSVVWYKHIFNVKSVKKKSKLEQFVSCKSVLHGEIHIQPQAQGKNEWESRKKASKLGPGRSLWDSQADKAC